MNNEEKAEILKSTEKLWNERNRLKELEKENAELKEKIEDFRKFVETLSENHENEIEQYKARIEKMKSFIHSEIDFCVYCPLTNECKNEEGTCPYACATEDEQKNLLMEFIQKWEKAE